MKSKTIIIITLTGIIFFTLDFFVKDFYQRKQKIEVPVSQTQTENSEQKINEKTENQSTDFSKMLKGKFILKGADYAGFEFIDDKTISWTN